jgi:(2Fe-2S) ferredoxin
MSDGIETRMGKTASFGYEVAARDLGRREQEDIMAPFAGRSPMPKPERHVLVCTNTRPPGNPKGSCGEKGSEALYAQLKDLVRERGLRATVIVSRTSCLKHCSRGITLAVYPDNVWYGAVRPDDLDEICASHLEGGRPVERLVMPDIPWE